MFNTNNRNIKVGEIYRYGDHQTGQADQPLHDGLPNWFYYTANSANLKNNRDKYPNLRFQAGIWNPLKITFDGIERVPVIICSTSLHQAGSAETPWTDTIDLSNGTAIYYGDNKPPANPDASYVRGNNEMIQAYRLQNSELLDDRLNAPAIILVSARDENGPKSGYKVVEGLCLIESYQLVQQDWLGQKFSNFEFHLKLLDMNSDEGNICMDWIHARRSLEISNDEANKYAPECWREYVLKGTKKNV